MICHIAIPIYRTINAETAFIETHKFGSTDNPEHPNNVIAEMSKETLAELGDKLNGGYTIVDTFETTNHTTTYRTYTLYKADSNSEAVAGELAMVRYVTRKQTFSNSTKQYFDFWKFSLTNERDVNVFDHPDQSRNTFKIAIDAGWEKCLKQSNYDDLYTLPTLIAVVVSNDGNWLKLEQIQPFADYPYEFLSGLSIESDEDIIE